LPTFFAGTAPMAADLAGGTTGKWIALRLRVLHTHRRRTTPGRPENGLHCSATHTQPPALKWSAGVPCQGWQSTFLALIIAPFGLAPSPRSTLPGCQWVWGAGRLLGLKDEVEQTAFRRCSGATYGRGGAGGSGRDSGSGVASQTRTVLSSAA